MGDKKALPPKLDEDLSYAKHYKPSQANQETTAQKMAKVFDDSKERAMYDEILGPMLGNKNQATSKAPLSNGGDFNLSILTRLKQVESEAKESRKKLAEQVALKENLQNENELLKALVSNPDEAMRETVSLRRQVTQLKVKISEMETFLGDYGLVWVGNNNPSPENKYMNNEQGREEVCSVDDPSEGTHAMSFGDFNHQIDELNAVIYSEPAQIVKEGSNQRKARLVQSSELLETVRIVFYRNGLMIKRGPFRSCDASNYHSFVQDIMDGYFPSEFQSEYPDGVIFDLKDQHTVIYEEGKTDPNFDQPQMSRAQFLNRLPKTVIHKGQVMDIRADIADRLGGASMNGGNGSSSGINGVSTAQDKVGGGRGRERLVIDNAGSKHESPVPLGCPVKIQVKWVDQSTFIVNLSELNTVGDLKASIEQHFAQDSTQEVDFELRSAFPPRVLEYSLTLKDAGLTPNGTVHARKTE